MELIVFLGIWLSLMIAMRNRFFGDPGSLWHIVLGERMLSSGKLIRFDLFSFTHDQTPWISQYWMAECFLAALHRIGGLDSIMTVTVIGLAGLYTWVAHRLGRAGIHPLLTGLIVAMAFAGGSHHFHPRPHILTLAFLGWTFAALCDFEAGRIALGRLFWLVPLFIIWANVHGGMVTGVFTVALAAIGWCLAWIVDEETPITRRQHFLTLVGLVIALGFAALVNPYGLALPRLWFGLIGSPVVHQVIQEHLPMRHAGRTALIVVPLALFYLAALAGIPLRRLRVTWLIPLVWLALTWSRIRNGPLFAIVAAIALGDMLPEVRWVHWLTRRGSEVFRLQPTGRALAAREHGFLLVVPLTLLVMSLVLQAAGLRTPLLGRGWAGLHADSNPVELLSELRAYERSQTVGARLFNEMHYSGFLIYSTPGLKVFIDDRCELYGDRWLLDYQDALLRNPARLGGWIREYGLDAALTQNGSKFDSYLASAQEWTLVKRAAKASFYRRLEGPCREGP